MLLLAIILGSTLVMLGLIYILILLFKPSLYERINWKKSLFRHSRFGILCTALSLIFIGMILVLVGLGKLNLSSIKILGTSAFLSMSLLLADGIYMSFKQSKK